MHKHNTQNRSSNVRGYTVLGGFAPFSEDKDLFRHLPEQLEFVLFKGFPLNPVARARTTPRRSDDDASTSASH
jgi:hypothetical protein